jgi:hypothetical protein
MKASIFVLLVIMPWLLLGVTMVVAYPRPRPAEAIIYLPKSLEVDAIEPRCWRGET